MRQRLYPRWVNVLRQIWDGNAGASRVAQGQQPIVDARRRARVDGIDPSISGAPTVLADPYDLNGRRATDPLAFAVPCTLSGP
jgi:hypothetical protein